MELSVVFITPPALTEQIQLRISRNDRIMHSVADLFQFGSQDTGRNSRKDQQKFISAIADQHICRTDAGKNRRGRYLQSPVAGLMSVSIIINFKIIQIDQGNSGCSAKIMYHFFIIAAVKRPVNASW